MPTRNDSLGPGPDGGFRGYVPRPDTLEAHLVGASRGNTEAFGRLYEMVAPRIYGLTLRILRDEHLSEEVTQEVLLEVWQTSSRFDPLRGSALSWLMTLAHHRAVDRVRSTDAERRRDATDAELSRVAPLDETATTAHASLEARAVRVALAGLPPGQRRALELAYLGGYTHSEVSRLLEVPLGTAKTRIRDGLIRLRDLLSPVAAELA